MAKYTTRRRRAGAAQRRRQAAAFARGLKWGVAALCLLAAVVISVWGGQGPVPTWTQLYLDAGMANAPPAVDSSGAAASEPTQIHFIDVGQGDAVLIQQDGQFALIDCGTEDCQTALLAYLEQAGAERLALLVMTHPHADHIGSMDAVLQNLTVEQLWLPQLDKAQEYPTSGAFERVIAAAEQHSVPTRMAQAGDTFALGSGQITVVGDGVQTDNYNDLSLCLRFTAGDFAFLATGDGEAAVEQALLDSGADLSATVFKAAHHGSRTSNTLPLLQAVRPQAVVVSCGLDNSYGHPHAEALQNYTAVGASVYRTDQQGSIVAGWSPQNGLTIYTSGTAQPQEDAA